jgi:hypothetical protein
MEILFFITSGDEIYALLIPNIKLSTRARKLRGASTRNVGLEPSLA